MSIGEAIPSIQKGFGYQAGCKEIVKYEHLPVEQPEGNEVLLKIEAAGMCQSDIHILIAQESHVPDKFVMGHEIAGQVVKKGPNNTNIALGGRYAAFICNGCGTCANCRSGRDNMCTGMGLIRDAFGITVDGGFQQFLLIKNPRSLIPIPDNVTYEEAASASDAVLTPFHAIMKVKHLLVPGSRVLVLGLGGLGLNALQILRNFGAQVVAVDVKKSVQCLAEDYGAEFFTDITDSDYLPESFDICFDFCGFQETFDSAMNYVKANGKIMMVGLGRSSLKLLNYHLGRREVEIIFSFGGTSLEQLQCMQWVAMGKIKPLTSIVDMDLLPEYLEKLKRGEIEGRVVFRPSKL